MKNFYTKLLTKDVKTGIQIVNALLNGILHDQEQKTKGHRVNSSKLEKAMERAEEWLEGVEGNV